MYYKYVNQLLINITSNMFQSFKGQTPVILDKVDTIAKGLATPHTDPIMFQSFKMRTPVTVDNVPDVTFTTKLEPPYSTYDICSRNVEAIILVSDQEIRAAVAKCYRTGLIVEPSGCAALAALMVGKVPGIDNDVNIANFWDGKEVGDRNKNSFKPISNEYIQYSPFVDEIDNTGIIWRLSMGGRLNVVVVLAGGNIGTSVLTNILLQPGLPTRTAYIK
ncbi:uncharacterized protein LOC135926024 isoform X2 [Gordionus sp. m RMFG-2023]|uniref:uncharacterized protein LOC135926024 isoform X2 n=1 Tax=Gordionus sp. m RMFG-2023 TaxID=3053472 RepID=UPI0031FC7E8E